MTGVSGPLETANWQRNWNDLTRVHRTTIKLDNDDVVDDEDNDGDDDQTEGGVRWGTECTRG